MLQAYSIEEEPFGASEVNIYTVKVEDEVASIIRWVVRKLYLSLIHKVCNGQIDLVFGGDSRGLRLNPGH